MKSNSTLKLFEQLGDSFIGLWRYRLRGEQRYFVCTVLDKETGDYIDSGYKKTIEGALEEGLRELARPKSKRRRRIK